MNQQMSSNSGTAIPLFDGLLHLGVALVPDVPKLVVRDHDSVVGGGFLDDVAVI